MGTENKKTSSIVGRLSASIDLDKGDSSNSNIAEQNISSTISSNQKKEPKGKNKDAFIRNIVNHNIDFSSLPKKSIIIPQDLHDKIGMLSSLTNIKQQEIVYAVLCQFFEVNEKEIKNLIKDFI